MRWLPKKFSPKRSSPSPRKVTLAAEDSHLLTNGHATLEPQQPQEGPQEAAGGHPERILVFPSSLFSEAPDTSLRPFIGFRTDAPEMAGRLFPKGVSSRDFLPRTPSLESDESMTQVVACVVPWHAASRQVWCFRRGATEGRLRGKLSCLVGGHVNFSDAYPADLTDGKVGLVPGPDFLDVTFAAVLREMGEELSDWEQNWKSHHSDCRLILMGVVRDVTTPVDRVHLGIVYRLDLARLDIPMGFAKEAGEAAEWVSVDGLPLSALPGESRLDGSVENWTQHVARHLSEVSPVRTGG